ncbi:MAG: YdcF family protein [Clostridia bacterium]|nr:YdcF family protein [Clostridia bacterium]
MKKRIITTVCIVIALIAALPFLISGFVTVKSQSRIIEIDEAADMDFDCILVLGAGVWGDEENARPSHMLEDRLKTGIMLYQAGASEKILMSGDHGQTDYDEVNVMKAFAVENGVPSENVFMDHAGFSTYESMYRAKEIFQAQKILIVTQKYHLYRAIYDARALGLDAYGVSADLRDYGGQAYYDLREILARDKDFLYCIFKPKPTYLGETIPVFGNGNVTND